MCKQRDVAVLFVAEDDGEKYFVERIGNGPWTLPQIHIFGSRDTVMNALSLKASHIGLSCNVGKEITYLDEFTYGGSSSNLISITVCCLRFWYRESARMVTSDEVFSPKARLQRSFDPAVEFAIERHQGFWTKAGEWSTVS